MQPIKLNKSVKFKHKIPVIYLFIHIHIYIDRKYSALFWGKKMTILQIYFYINLKTT